ncbi:hypothetical protein GYMLUDRAFT_252014 [Collybiopsis luxurians FD-317 M1]|uniref:Uncharacterized protein n=1 Tax=Collybiopsis luxurians FD-317 M1 TaxID=944289 RepID=A0A0D0C9R3_9AGAR|nr:hypothetical protein GYMLUDRAFT_252014 [Collybiopsis luxurians FD-317 M1]
MIPVLTKALQDTQNHVTKLEQELQAAKTFETENAILRKRITELQGGLTVKKEENVDSTIALFDTGVGRAKESSELTKIKVELKEEQEKTQHLQTELQELQEENRRLRTEQQKSQQKQGELTGTNDELRANIGALQEKYNNAKMKRKETRREMQELQGKIKSLERLFADAQAQESQPTTMLAKIQTRLQYLPLIPSTTRRLVNGPRLNSNVDILSYLKLAAPKIQWSEKHFFFFPRSISMHCGSNQHYLTCSPVTETIPGTEFVVRSPYECLDGQAREFFTTRAGFATYAGIYKCLRMDEFTPNGMALPTGLPAKSVAYEASLENAKKPKPGFPSQHDLQKMYESGKLKVEFTIFQCIGYNQSLADSLIQYDKNQERGWKRSWEDAVGPQAGPVDSPNNAVKIKKIASPEPPSTKRRKTGGESVEKVAASDPDSDAEDTTSESDED